MTTHKFTRDPITHRCQTCGETLSVHISVPVSATGQKVIKPIFNYIQPYDPEKPEITFEKEENSK